MKISITLSDEVVRTVDQMKTKHHNRSQFIENILRQYLATSLKSAREAKDKEILQQRAIFLNQEAEDVLTYQVIP